MTTEWLLVAAVVALIAANGIFVAAPEFALVTVDRPTVNTAAQTASSRSRTSLRRSSATSMTSRTVPAAPTASSMTARGRPAAPR